MSETSAFAHQLISIAEYDRLERKAIVSASYPAIRAFAPVAFNQVNFPTRVSDETELLRYADILQELNDTNETYRTRPYSDVEANLILTLSKFIETLTSTHWSRPTQPFTALFTPILVLRAMSRLADGRSVKVLEVGPGSGHLGAYTIMCGQRYCAVDNTQSLYLWQNRLFGFLATELRRSFAERALEEKLAPELNDDITHVPWWHFADMFRRPPSFDIVVCDATMGEMSVFSVHYLIRLAALMLADSPIGAFLFRHLGEQRVNTLDYVSQRFERAGFRRHALGPVTAYSQNDLQLEGESSPLGPIQSCRPACEFLPIDKTKLLDSYAFFDFLNLRG